MIAHNNNHHNYCHHQYHHLTNHNSSHLSGILEHWTVLYLCAVIVKNAENGLLVTFASQCSAQRNRCYTPPFSLYLEGNPLEMKHNLRRY